MATDDEFTTEDGFTIPELPHGRTLEFNLTESWGCPSFIGLSGLEIFTATGNRAAYSSISTTGKETVGAVEDLITLDRCPALDPKRAWACQRPHDGEQPVKVVIELECDQTIAMIRVWNYAESRVHALRGVRYMVVALDDTKIFEGRISCSFDSDNEDQRLLGDTILFTTNPDILSAIAENDVFLKEYEVTTMASQMNPYHGDFDASNANALPSPENCLTDERILRPKTVEEACGDVDGLFADSSTVAFNPENRALQSKVVHMELTSNWGHATCIGLAGVQFYGNNGAVVPLDKVIVHATHVPPGRCTGTPKNLVNGQNLTCNPSDMWLVPFDANASTKPVLSFTFPANVALAGVSIWNYNASPELSLAGVQRALLFVNGKAVVGAVLLRKAPGFVYFDYVQDVTFDRCHLFRPLSSRPNTRSVDAFIFQLRLLSTWGDEYYIGLNGIELYNRRNHVITLGHQNIAAFPESVNILPTVRDDPRSSDKLIDGENDTTRASHMWLTPMLPNRYARVFVIFDSPTFVSRIRIFNYRKTPERGVRHITISADDLIVFSGEVPMSTASETGILDVDLRAEIG